MTTEQLEKWLADHNKPETAAEEKKYREMLDKLNTIRGAITKQSKTQPPRQQTSARKYDRTRNDHISGENRG